MKESKRVSFVSKIPPRLAGWYKQVEAGLSEHRRSGRYKVLHGKLDKLRASMESTVQINPGAIETVLRDIASELDKPVARTSGGTRGRPPGSTRPRNMRELDLKLLDQAKADIRSGTRAKPAVRRAVKKQWPDERSVTAIEAHVRRLLRQLKKEEIDNSRLKEQANRDILRLQTLVATGLTPEQAIVEFNRERTEKVRETIAVAGRTKAARLKPYLPEKS